MTAIFQKSNADKTEAWIEHGQCLLKSYWLSKKWQMSVISWIQVHQ